MLKFVTTKNFKMPGNHQCLGIEVKRDSAGNLVQTERWTESVVIPGAGGEDKKVDVPFTKKYVTTEKSGVMTVAEEISTLYSPSSKCSLKPPTPIKPFNTLTCTTRSLPAKGSVFDALYKPAAPISVSVNAKLPPTVPGLPPLAHEKGTVYDTLYKPALKKRHRGLVDNPLYTARKAPAAATSIPAVPTESYMKISQRLTGITTDRNPGWEGEVVEEYPLNKYSVKEFVKVLNAQGAQACVRKPEGAKQPKSTGSFAHRVKLSEPIRLTSR